MSAFMCSSKHISALVNAAHAYNRKGGMRIEWLGNGDEDTFRILAEENARSVSYRYPDH